MDMLLPFFLTCLIIEATAGPNMGYLAVLSASHGRRAGFAALVGVALGLLIIGIAAALGLAVVISNSPFLYQMLRWGGVLYMLYLAWESWRVEEGFSHRPKPQQDAKFFRRGLITNILNPKAFVFYVAVLPLYIPQDQGFLQAYALFLTVIYVAVATIIHIGIVMMAARAQGFLKDVKRREFVRKVFAVILVGIAVWLILKT